MGAADKGRAGGCIFVPIACDPDI